MVPTGRFMAGQLMGLADGGRGQAHRGDGGAGTGPDGQVAGHGERFRRQGRETHRVAPFVEQPPLGGVDAPGVVGEDGLQGIGHALVGGAQGRRSGGRAGDDLRVGGGGHKQESGGGALLARRAASPLGTGKGHSSVATHYPFGATILVGAKVTLWTRLQRKFRLALAQSGWPPAVYRADSRVG